MRVFRARVTGSYDKAESILRAMTDDTKYYRILSKYGEAGVQALAQATPKDTGETAASWSYKIYKTRKGLRLAFYNSNMAGDVPVVIVLHYGHATRNGYFVPGNDFINPVIKPIFDRFMADLELEVTHS